MDVEEALKQIGLADEEVRIYLATLRLGASRASQIA